MVSKRWQRTQRVIEHAGLALGVGLPLSVIELDYAPWLKLVIIVVGYILLVPLMHWLHRRFATTFVKVYRCDYEVAARVVQRMLNAKGMPFTKQSGSEQVLFHIRSGNMQLEVDAFMLNMPIDDHIKPEVATKLTLHTETADNVNQMEQLRAAIDEVFALKGC